MNLTWLFSWRSKKQQDKPNDSEPKQQPKRQPTGAQRKAAPGNNPTNRTPQPAAAPRPPALTERPFEVNLNIGRYRMEPFTEGGICVVMKGIPLEQGKPKLAVKLVREQWLNHQAVRRQFTTESQIVRELHHPQLPKYRSRGLIDGKAYYAYEFIEGFQLINLSQEQQRFPPALVKEIAKDLVSQLLEQLHFLHTSLKPVVHGDISSENILIDSKQKIYLVDFGCSHFQKQASRESYQWLAKPSFISPEQARGDRWDHRSDLYQAGILLFELLRNRRWNEGGSKREKVLFAASNERKADDFLTDVTDAKTSSFVAKMLDPDPGMRFQSAKEALIALRE
ncbi:serine/threonine protein kinase [Ketobacter sp. MCCC 1A13808]|uniref:serine/threonine protein kinase n=1 Tax=Ketobacter sp. MCCC 1A13808 TaxID=2602738 RepID=UPI000F1A0E15|nr:serine/threonine-protein kinase [Ketobacter sp. MCCC 1A13808]MVF12537.1 serine/threonine protein kinase [Ketobacter sp. MCCC 1A13808]RLP55660.1 MAG: serine/threonine protein kinase [Ketobacter sp.]